MNNIYKISLPVLAYTLLSTSSSHVSMDSDNRKGNEPNIIFIFADDLGWGDLGCYGHPHLKTPSLDRMAKSGILFTNFYVANPVSSPSRTAVMTGQYPARHRVHTAISNSPQDNSKQEMANYLDPRSTLITRLFKENGYKTGHFGKWHLGSTPDAPLPLDYGIDECLVLNSRDQQLKGPRSESTEKIVDAAISFIEKNKNEKFFVNVWTLVPHATLAPTEEQMKPYEHLGPGGEAKG